jgi:hypothetical protein
LIEAYTLVTTLKAYSEVKTEKLGMQTDKETITGMITVVTRPITINQKTDILVDVNNKIYEIHEVKIDNQKNNHIEIMIKEPDRK